MYSQTQYQKGRNDYFSGVTFDEFAHKDWQDGWLDACEEDGDVGNDEDY